MCMFCISLLVLLFYFFCSLCSLFFFDLRMMITLLYIETLPNVKLELIGCLFPHKCTSQYTSKLQWSNTFLVKTNFVLIYVFCINYRSFIQMSAMHNVIVINVIFTHQRFYGCYVWQHVSSNVL